MKGLKMKAGLLALSLAFVGAGVGVWNSSVEAQAADGAFYMTKGASVSTSEEFGGIRWQTTVETEWFNAQTGEITEFGTLVAANVEGELTKDTPNVVKIVAADIEASEADAVYYSAIKYDDIVSDWQAQNPNDTTSEADLLAAAYKLELTALSYAIIDGEYVYATAEDTARSARQVANSAELFGELEGKTQAVVERVQGYMGSTQRTSTTTWAGLQTIDLSNAETQTVTFPDTVSETVEEVLLVQKGVMKKLDKTAMSGNTLTVTDTTGYPVGETYLSVIVAGKVYSAPILVATKVLKTSADLEMFYMEPASSYANKKSNYVMIKGDEYKFNGYYVLGNNLDATADGYENLIRNNGPRFSSWSSAGTAVYKTSADRDAKENAIGTVEEFGLVGTFNGNGYVIKNQKIGHGGIFGLIGEGGKVKNVGFDNITVTAESVSGYACVLATRTYDVNFELSNVYVTNTNGPLLYPLVYGGTFTNVVIDSSDNPDAKIFAQQTNTDYDVVKTDVYEMPAAEMVADFTGGLGTFSNELWKIGTDGVPVFKNA